MDAQPVGQSGEMRLQWLLGREPAVRDSLRVWLGGAVAYAAGLLSVGFECYWGWWSVRSTLLIAVSVVLSQSIFYGMLRSGRSQRFNDPRMLVPQVSVAVMFIAVAYVLTPIYFRGDLIAMVMVALAGTAHAMTRRGQFFVSLFAALAMGAVVLVSMQYAPDARVEVVHLLMMLGAIAGLQILVRELSGLQQRFRRKDDELTHALSRIEQLAMRDELTGLVNRRFMLDLVEQQRQRGARAGHGFCVAVIRIEPFESLVQRAGVAAGDEALRIFAREALRVLRMSDVLGRWETCEFVLLMPDSRGALARLGVERLREHIAALSLRIAGKSMQMHLSIGLAEHRAGEPAQDTLARAEDALGNAVEHGGNRVLVA